jgi:hypothetical protein
MNLATVCTNVHPESKKSRSSRGDPAYPVIVVFTHCKKWSLFHIFYCAKMSKCIFTWCKQTVHWYNALSKACRNRDFRRTGALRFIRSKLKKPLTPVTQYCHIHRVLYTEFQAFYPVVRTGSPTLPHQQEGVAVGVAYPPFGSKGRDTLACRGRGGGTQYRRWATRSGTLGIL